MGETSRLQTLGAANTTQIGDMAIPVRGEGGRIVGVIAAHVSWRRAAHHPERLTNESGPPAATETYVLNRDGVVLIGPDEVRQKLWNGIAINSGRRVASAGSFQKATNAPQFERLPNGKHVRVSRSQLSAGNEIGALGWQVQLSEPNERVYQRANALAFRILWVSMCLGVATALLGTMGARHLTGRLKRLALSVVSVGQSEGASIEFPRGVDEVAQLGAAFATILGSEALLRMAQEALRNVERHSKATRVAVRLRSTNDGRLELRVEDNGIGFDPGALRPGHYGIVGLREQAELIGADLRIDSKPNEGTTLCVSMRLSPITFNQTDKTIPP
jgi:C4-dicarboxylate-specific signal transduction histidine kinase